MRSREIALCGLRFYLARVGETDRAAALFRHGPGGSDGCVLMPPAMTVSRRFQLVHCSGPGLEEHSFEEIAAAQPEGWRLNVVVPQDRHGKVSS